MCLLFIKKITILILKVKGYSATLQSNTTNLWIITHSILSFCVIGILDSYGPWCGAPAALPSHELN